jgi:hypothetical protein
MIGVKDGDRKAVSKIVEWNRVGKLEALAAHQSLITDVFRSCPRDERGGCHDAIVAKLPDQPIEPVFVGPAS